MKRFVCLLVIMVSTLGLFSFSNYNADTTKTSIASYYHDKFNGKKTASGEIFSNSGLTGANRTLPFGTKIKVTNIKNGESVIVRINDRGPYHSSRSLDLSKAAFMAIAERGEGKIAVEYQVVEQL